jgi:hypothetical protein
VEEITRYAAPRIFLQENSEIKVGALFAGEGRSPTRRNQEDAPETYAVQSGPFTAVVRAPIADERVVLTFSRA